ncbi:DUF4007 family protein [Gordonia sp. zg691]|uniref:DUF4007 family protein n=1 Tax=Gordonia jinghuaiqii TaxID=2758710 RepID=UPI0016628421|nr:DUF4007 family protein [Gordonia jinghuaiqii]MBD0862455.1 DUF4007 family protein [Gordonia jinghuaiqii]
MTLEQAAQPLFAGHQTFHPRFGWIKKGYDAAARNPDVFSEPDAPVNLGVGKNMVEAIRFWAVTTRVIMRLPHPERPRQSIHVPTALGASLFSDDFGLDPFIEDPTTLWMLHWHALSAPSLLPIWRSTFNDFTPTEFTEQTLLDFCIDEIAATTWKQPKPSSIGKDVDCLLRMYTRREARARQTLDDLLDSPFRELGLVLPAPGTRSSYRFIRGPKPGLTDTAIIYACLDFMSRDRQTSSTVTRLAVDPGSPGRIFKISEDDIVVAAETVASRVGGLTVARPAGTNQLVVSGDPDLVLLSLVTAHHRIRGRQAADLDNVRLGATAAIEPSDGQLALTDNFEERPFK